MAVKVRPYKRGGWEVDITGTMPDGTPYRLRKKAPVTSKSGAKRWGEERERALLLGARTTTSAPNPLEKKKKKKEVPTLEEFIKPYSKNLLAQRRTHAALASKESYRRAHLLPVLGHLRLDQIDDRQVARLCFRLKDVSAKHSNNVLTELNVILKLAVKWKVIGELPCSIELLKVPRTEMEFYDFDQYEALLRAATSISRTAELVVRLGGQVGLRLGEIIALEQGDIDFNRNSIHIQHAETDGVVGLPKHGKTRRVPMTTALAEALRRHRHLRGPRVLYEDDGKTLTPKLVYALLRRARRAAGLGKPRQPAHILRHTFCSHLAMRGAPVRAIQQLAGHANLSTTLKYMHLTEDALQDAIALLNDEARLEDGDILETGVDAG